MGQNGRENGPMNIVIVESPAKAKTINKYLGKDYKVLASYGHIRDLPSKDGSVKPDENFAMTWSMEAKSKKRVDEIAAAVKKADKLILATDPDREGEAISWHLMEVLRQKKVLNDMPVERVVFNAITKSAVTEAMEQPRAIDDDLVAAYLARRALDYLVGFTLSPVLWRKLPGARSAGRVQSVALRLICQREIEIEAFNAREYWTIETDLATAAGARFPARLWSLNGDRLDKFALPDEAAAKAAQAAIEAQPVAITSIEKKPVKRNPQPPFITSTLQQEASRKLGFSASRTMQVAQRLYEGMEIDGETVGLITYMRTDGVQMAPEGIASARAVIQSDYGGRYLPDAPRQYKSKAKNAQEAHEAIRPTELQLTPKKLSGRLETDQARLYDLIWKRTIASQMASAELERTTVDIGSADGKVGLRTTGTVTRFDGFLTVYQESTDEPESDENGSVLPQMNEGETLERLAVKPEQHFTEPPPRFSEASLVKRMEELGIGRPSTYASILSVLGDRNYVRLDKKRFIPEDKGRVVTAFLESFFTRYVEYDFTSGLEEKLDAVSDGKMLWKSLLQDFWTEFIGTVDGIADLRVSQVLDVLNDILAPHIFPETEPGKDPRNCPTCDTGRLSVKLGKFGAFIGCSDYPECRYTRPLSQSADESGGVTETKVLGLDPETGTEITLRAGRFGPYVQLGEPEDGEKPKRGGIPKGMDPMSVDIDLAVKLMSLPRDVGTHPDTGKMIKAGNGRFGPYINHAGVYASLESPEELFTIGINRAVTLLAEKAAKGGRQGASKALKELGPHPDDEQPVRVLDGRYGPYVKHGKINATIPKDTDPETITMEQAVDMIAAKAAKGGKKKKPAKKKAAKKPAKKKAAKKPAKKAAAKKTAKPKAKKAATKKTAAKSKSAKSPSAQEPKAPAEAE